MIEDLLRGVKPTDRQHYPILDLLEDVCSILDIDVGELSRSERKELAYQYLGLGKDVINDLTEKERETRFRQGVQKELLDPREKALSSIREGLQLDGKYVPYYYVHTLL